MSSIFSKLTGKVQKTASAPSRKPKWVRWVILGVVVIVVGAGVFAIVKVRQTKAAASEGTTLQTSTARSGTLTLQATGSGYLVASSEANIAFEVDGELSQLYIALGDTVEKGQLVAQLDDTTLQYDLEEAQLALLELTSPEAIANAELAVTSAQTEVINAQIAVNDLQYWENETLIKSYYAKYIVAKNALEQAQENYDKVAAGRSLNDPAVASAYQSVYSALTAYNTAEYYYSLYSQKPTQRQIDEAQASLDLAQAQLTNAQNYLAALEGGEVPDDATGADLATLRKAQLAVKSAQENLDATKLYAPISGIVMSLNVEVGETVSANTTVMTIDDLSVATIDFYLDESDWTNVKVGYEASITFDALPGQAFIGTVTEVMPGLVSVGGMSMIEGTAEIDKSVEEIGLPVGVEAGVDIISGQATDAVLVPVEALHELSDGTYTVFVVVDGTPTLRTVEVGLQDDTFAQITSGLEAGEVVTTGVVETKQ